MLLHTAIAAGELGVLVVAIFLYQSLTTGFAASIADGAAWGARLAQYARLAGIANEVVLTTHEQLYPGATSFDPARLEAAISRFDQELDEARAELAQAPADGARQALQKDLGTASLAMREFSTEVSAVSSYLRQNEPARMAAQLRELWQDGASLQSALDQLAARARSAQQEALEADELGVSLARRTSWLLVGLAVVMLVLIVRHAIQLRRVMQHAEAAVDAALRSKGTFLGQMSYAIRTPMNAIIGMSELVLDTPLTREQRGSLEVVKSSAETLLTTLTNVLDYAKLQEGRLDLEERAFDVRSAINDVIRVMTPRASRKGLELVWHLAPEVPVILRGDAKRLQQILANLLDAAINRCEDGEIVIRGRSSGAIGDEVLLVFDVSDSGSGISPEQRSALAGALRNGKDAATSLEDSVGLGLAVSARLVRMMNGRISVESAPERGNTFRIMARFAIESARPEAIESPQGNELRDLRVLVLDDNISSRQILCAMLRGARALPTPAKDAEEAMAMLRTAHEADRDYPIALVDLALPGESALELAREVKADPDLSRTVLIALGVSGEAEETEPCRRAGIEHVLVKPIRSAQLLDAVRGVLLKRGIAPRMRDGSGVLSRPLRVLLVDDNRVDRTLAARLLAKRGHQVLAVDSGEEAVARSAEERFDVILMDVQMQQMDGLEATRAIRLREKHTGDHVPIIALTAHDMKGRCAEVGMDDYVTKPMDAQEVSDVITRNVPALESQGGVEGTAMGAQLPLDEEAALERAGGERALLIELAGMCLADAPAAIDEIRGGLAQRNPETVQRAAHKLKGSLLVLAADPASEAAYRVETLSAQGSLDQAAAALAALEQEIDRLKPVLSALARSEAPQED